MNTVGKKQLEKLSGFQVANAEVLKSIVGGTLAMLEADSKKKDVGSKDHDSASNDTFSN
jgi:hypothetical protein